MKNKWSFVYLFLFSLFLVYPTITYAQVDVIDDANLFSPEQTTQIENKLHSIEQLTDTDGMVVTTNDTKGKTSRDFADDYYDQNNSGGTNGDSGFLLLLDMDNRNMYLSTSGKMIKTMTDRRIESMLDAAIPDMSSGEYAKATMIALSKIENNYQSDQPGFNSLKIVLAITIGLVVSILIYISIQARYQLKSKQYQYPFHEKSQLQLTDSQDTFLTSFTTTRRIPRSNGPGGGSSTHRSSGGGTHGGGGRGF